MDPLFVNQITLSNKVIYEFYKKDSALPYWAYRALKIVLPMYGIWLILLYLIKSNWEDLFQCAAGIICGLLFIFLFPIYIRYIAKIRYRQSTLLNGGSDMQRKTEFGEQICVTSSNKAETCFDYAQIKHICETENLIILRSVCAVGIIVGKESFTVGTLEDFRRFIQEKCPSAHYFS